MDKKISVIIPIYNVKKFLEKCLTSVVNQTYKNLEIILINDGSTDNSLDICNEFVKKDERIKLINKENEGLSAARNTGLKLATGEYIGFIDSDDWIDLDFYEKLYNAIEKNQADIACASIERVGQFVKKFRVHYLEEKITENFKENLKICNYPKNSYVWNKLYKAELVKNTFFKEGVYFEDVIWTSKILEKSSKIVAVPNIKYYYFKNKFSIVKSKSTPKKQKDLYDSHKYMVNFLIKHGVKLSEKQQTLTKSKKYLFNILVLKIKEYNYTQIYYLFGFLPVFSVTKYPKIEVINE